MKIPIEISLKFVRDGWINIMLAFFQVMAWCQAGLVPSRQQAIIWTNDDQVIWHHMASLGPNDCFAVAQIANSWGQHGAHLGPVGPKWAPCWPHEPSYQGG